MTNNNMMIAPKLPIFGFDVLDELVNYQLRLKFFFFFRCFTSQVSIGRGIAVKYIL